MNIELFELLLSKGIEINKDVIEELIKNKRYDILNNIGYSVKIVYTDNCNHAGIKLENVLISSKKDKAVYEYFCDTCKNNFIEVVYIKKRGEDI